MKNQIINKGENIITLINWLESNNATKIFLVSGNDSFKLSGSKKYLKKVLNHYQYVRFSDFSENPKIEDVYKGVEIMNNEKCDCCIIIGGGSVMDMGKLICYLKEETTSNPNLIVRNELTHTERKIPICAVPTTAGSGAESTHFAVVYIDNKKYSLSHHSILPDKVILNPKLSYSMSSYLKAVTGIDALAQGIESYWSKNATVQSRKLSAAAIELVWNNLTLSVLENSFTAHQNVVIGSNLAGRAINISKTTAAHAISYYFTSEHNINHGHAVALTLGKVYEFNYQKSINSNNEIKKVFNALSKLLQIDANPRFIIEQFISDLNIELDYSKLNIDINKELALIKREVNTERLNNNPFQIEENDFDTLILK